jgi:REP element-mobilizing transposase RayT
MPREAREKKLYSNYHIQQTCDQAIKIFRNKQDRLLFIDTLKKVKDKYHFKLYGLCINKSGYELILYDNGSDISKIMKSLNISFAMNYKCNHESCKVVFKERYKSKILTTETLQVELNQLGKCVYADATIIDAVEDLCQGNACIDCYEKANEKLSGMLSDAGLTHEALLKQKKLRNEWIKEFRRNTTLSLSELGNLFGGLSESGVSRILNK